MSTFRHTEAQVASYHADPRMKQSGLKIIAQEGIQAFLRKMEEALREEEWYSEKEHFKIGKAVDFSLSQGEDQFYHAYHFSNAATTPSGAVLSITRKVFEWALIRKEGQANRIDGFDQYRDLIYEACNTVETMRDGKLETGYYMKRAAPIWEEDTRWLTVAKNGGTDYFGELIENYGKVILSEEEGDIIVKVVNSFKSHPHTSRFFLEEEGVDIVYQMPLFFDYEGVACKILPDMMRIDHNARKVYPFDFKTHGGDILSFILALRARRYDIQGSFYNYGIWKNLATISNLIGKDIEGYRMASFAFLCESTKYPGTPMVFVMTDDMMTQGVSGDGKKLMGWNQAMARYNLWRRHEFSLENRFAETNGVVFMDQFFEYTVNI